jgi:hypothetical protein
VITDTAAQIADPGYEAHFRKRLRWCPALETVALHLSDFTFRLLRRGVDCLTIRVAGRVLKGSNVRASSNSLRTGEGLPVRDSETEWIKFAVQKPTLSIASATAWSAFTAATALSSIARRAPLLRERDG